VNDHLEESIEILQAIVRSERLLRAGRALSEDEAKIVSLSDCCRLANVRERLKPILDSFKISDELGRGNPS
jgi:hypothetical protein